MIPYTFIGPGGFFFFGNHSYCHLAAGLRLFCIDLLKDVNVLFVWGPDLNPSEHLYDLLEKQSKMNTGRFWRNLKFVTLHKLIKKMAQQMHAITTAKWTLMKYYLCVTFFPVQIYTHVKKETVYVLFYSCLLLMKLKKKKK